jgi:hypothetical protein
VMLEARRRDKPVAWSDTLDVLKGAAFGRNR